MKRVLITGIMGFTGRYAAADLEAHGWEVWGLGSRKNAASSRYHCVDLADPMALAETCDVIRPHAVLHLAGLAFVGHGEANDLYRINLMGTRNLLAVLAAGQTKPECIVLASSANVYGNASGGIVNEAVAPAPTNDYAVSKWAMEQMARLWFDRLPIVIVRPFNYTGVGQSEVFVLPKIVAHFRSKAATIELGNLDVWRDFSDVRAVVEAYRRLLTASPAGEVVNVCSGRSWSLQEVLRAMEDMTSWPMEVKINPAYVRAREVRTLCGDAAKLRAIIGPWDTPPLTETLRWMLEA